MSFVRMCATGSTAISSPRQPEETEAMAADRGTLGAFSVRSGRNMSHKHLRTIIRFIILHFTAVIKRKIQKIGERERDLVLFPLDPFVKSSL